MRHESWEVGKGTRGSEEERKGEWDWRRDIGVTGGSGDHRNREEKGEKGQYHCMMSGSRILKEKPGA